MSATPAVVDGMLDESLLGVLLILLVVLLSTGYVYMQQLQPGAAGARDAARLANRRPDRTPGTGAPTGAATSVKAVATAGLSERQLKLHYSLPARHGARTLTVSADALLDRSDAGTLTWKSDGAAALLADLARVADVYVLCALPTAGEDVQKAEVECVRAFVAASAELQGRVKPHKVLFCATRIGEIAFVRQLEPQVHVEGACALWTNPRSPALTSVNGNNSGRGRRARAGEARAAHRARHERRDGRAVGAERHPRHGQL
jgi:hypothetical protein